MFNELKVNIIVTYKFTRYLIRDLTLKLILGSKFEVRLRFSLQLRIQFKSSQITIENSVEIRIQNKVNFLIHPKQIWGDCICSAVCIYTYDFFSFLSIRSLSRIGIVNLYDNWTEEVICVYNSTHVCLVSYH